MCASQSTDVQCIAHLPILHIENENSIERLFTRRLFGTSSKLNLRIYEKLDLQFHYTFHTY